MQSKPNTHPVYVALGPGLRSCPEVLTLGVRDSIGAYSSRERDLMREASVVFFPTGRFIDVFEASGKRTFPSPSTYRFLGSRLHQELLLRYLELPHPRTRFYFGDRQKLRVPNDFDYPFFAMGSGSASAPPRTVAGEHDLGPACRAFNPLIVQEAPAWDERLRLVCIGSACAGAFRLSGGAVGTEDWQPVNIGPRRSTGPAALEPKGAGACRPGGTGTDPMGEILASTLRLMSTAGLDDTLFEWARSRDRWLLVRMERPPRTWPTPRGVVDHGRHVCELVRSGYFR